MGTSRSGAELGRKLMKYGTNLPNRNRDAVSAAALRYKEAALRNAERDTGGDRRLSKWKNRFGLKRGASPKLSAGYRLYGTTNAKAILTPRPYGIWAVLDGGAAPHRITPFRYKRSARNAGAARALKFPGAGREGDGYTGAVDHPGTKGKRTFRDAAKAEPAALRSFAKVQRDALFEVFR